MAFIRDILVRFQHADPAGIVFYPRYMEMINATVEDWFASLQYDFATIVRSGAGIPTVHLSVDFRAPSVIGETLRFALRVVDSNEYKVTLIVTAHCGHELRLEGKVILVHCMRRDGRDRAAPMPSHVFAAIKTVQESI